MYTRFLAPLILESLSDSPIVLISGARQTGKTTLVRSISEGDRAATYVNLDDASFLSAATSDPAGFLAGLNGRVVIDEVQHAPMLFPAIKAAVDHERTPGRFLLTGSANVLLLPKLSESLAGRMDILTLWPLSQAEIAGAGAGFIDLLFNEDLKIPNIEPLSRGDLMERILAGGFPEPLERKSEIRRRAWFSSYTTAILQRDIRDIADIQGLTEIPRLLALLTTRMASLLNVADISRSAGISYTTLNRYMSLLQATYLVQLLPAWSANIGLRIVRSPKLIVNDTGLAASLIGLDALRLSTDSVLWGQILENFAIMELIKLIDVSRVLPKPFHYRTVSGAEVDMVLEAPDGRLVGIEIKASSTVTAKDFRGLHGLSNATGDRFCRGIVLYTGMERVPFGENFVALPIQTLWSMMH